VSVYVGYGVRSLSRSAMTTCEGMDSFQLLSIF